MNSKNSQGGFVFIKTLTFIILFLLCVCFSCISIYLIYSHISYKNQITESARNQVVTTTVKASRDIDNILREVMSTGNRIADDLTAGKLKKNQIIERLKKTMEEHPDYYGVLVAYEPYTYDPKVRLYGPYYMKKQEKLQLVQLESLYDYTGLSPECVWYFEAKKKGAMWSEPFFGKASETLVTTYSVPFYTIDPKTNKRNIIGVIAVVISIDDVKNIVESLNLGTAGYGAVTSKKGVYIYHPTKEYVINQRTIFDVAREKNDRTRIIMGKKAIKGERGIIDHISTTTGLNSWLIFEPILSTGWSLQNTFLLDDISFDIDALRQQLIWILLSVLITVLLISSIILGIHKGNEVELWTMSIITSIALLVGIGFIWHLALTYAPNKKKEGFKITDRISINNFINSYNNVSLKRHLDPPIYIPTGILVKSAEFTSANNVEVTGYIWQKFYDGIHNNVSRGFIISNSKDMEVRESYRYREKDMELIGWYFSGTLQENFNYSKYPLDRGNVLINIKPNDFNSNTVLIPDLQSYKLINPSSLPGLEKNLTLAGWEIEKTYFEFRESINGTNLGIKNYIREEGFPELYYKIVVKRNFIDAFISNLTPLLIVSFMLFAVLIATTKDEDKIKLLITGTGRTLSFCAALFFVIVFSHIAVRQKIAAQQIFYLEYFYFLMYFVVLWISINSILVPLADRMRLIQYKENLFSKLIYWPLILGILFVITLINFY